MMNRSSVTNALLAVVALLLFLNLLSGPGIHASAASTVQYKVAPLHSLGATQEQIEGVLSQQGANGWELIMNYGTPSGDILIFKK